MGSTVMTKLSVSLWAFRACALLLYRLGEDAPVPLPILLKFLQFILYVVEDSQPQQPNYQHQTTTYTKSVVLWGPIPAGMDTFPQVVVRWAGDQV
jgi:hypothetical protein